MASSQSREKAASPFQAGPSDLDNDNVCPPVILQGKLMERSRGTLWEEGWYVLDCRNLTKFAGEGAFRFSKRPMAVYPLSTLRIRDGTFDSLVSRGHTAEEGPYFELVRLDYSGEVVQVLILRAFSRDEKLRWLQAFEQASSLTHNYVASLSVSKKTSVQADLEAEYSSKSISRCVENTNSGLSSPATLSSDENHNGSRRSTKSTSRHRNADSLLSLRSLDIIGGDPELQDKDCSSRRKSTSHSGEIVQESTKVLEKRRGSHIPLPSGDGLNSRILFAMKQISREVESRQGQGSLRSTVFMESLKPAKEVRFTAKTFQTETYLDGGEVSDSSSQRTSRSGVRKSKAKEENSAQQYQRRKGERRERQSKALEIVKQQEQLRRDSLLSASASDQNRLRMVIAEGLEAESRRVSLFSEPSRHSSMKNLRFTGDAPVLSEPLLMDSQSEDDVPPMAPSPSLNVIQSTDDFPPPPPSPSLAPPSFARFVELETPFSPPPPPPPITLLKQIEKTHKSSFLESPPTFSTFLRSRELPSSTSPLSPPLPPPPHTPSLSPFSLHQDKSRAARARVRSSICNLLDKSAQNQPVDLSQLDKLLDDQVSLLQQLLEERQRDFASIPQSTNPSNALSLSPRNQASDYSVSSATQLRSGVFMSRDGSFTSFVPFRRLTPAKKPAAVPLFSKTPSVPTRTNSTSDTLQAKNASISRLLNTLTPHLASRDLIKERLLASSRTTKLDSQEVKSPSTRPSSLSSSSSSFSSSSSSASPRTPVTAPRIMGPSQPMLATGRSFLAAPQSTVLLPRSISLKTDKKLIPLKRTASLRTIDQEAKYQSLWSQLKQAVSLVKFESKEPLEPQPLVVLPQSKNTVLSEDEELKKRMRFERIVEEIIQSEQAYIDNLKVLWKLYLLPLRDEKLARKLQLHSDDIKSIFSCVETIMNFHEVMLLDLTSEPDVSKVFLKYSPFLKIYVQYVSSYDALLKTIAKSSEVPAFQNYMRERQSNKASKGLDMTAFLIMPIQRVPRYELLLRELLTNCVEFDSNGNPNPQHSSISQAYQKVVSINSAVNESKRQVEMMSETLQIQNRFQSLPAGCVLLAAHRKFMLGGELITEARSFFGGAKFFKVFLFNDILIWANENWKFQGCFDLIQIEFEAYELEPGNLIISFIPIRPSDFPAKNHPRALHLHCRDLAEKEMWVHHVKSCISWTKTPRRITRHVKASHKMDH